MQGGEAEGAAQNPELLAMLRGNLQPLEVYGVPKLLPRVSLALSRILQACHQQFASYTLNRCILTMHLLCSVGHGAQTFRPLQPFPPHMQTLARSSVISVHPPSMVPSGPVK